MGYIIIWRNSHREPFPDLDSRDFLETYPTFEAAKTAADAIQETQNEVVKSPWYFDYKIYEEANS